MKPLQHRAAILLSAGQTVSAAAASLRLHRSTIHLWLKRADFKALIEAEARAALSAVRSLSHHHERQSLINVIAGANNARLERRDRRKIRARLKAETRVGDELCRKGANPEAPSHNVENAVTFPDIFSTMSERKLF